MRSLVLQQADGPDLGEVGAIEWLSLRLRHGGEVPTSLRPSVAASFWIQPRAASYIKRPPFSSSSIARGLPVRVFHPFTAPPEYQLLAAAPGGRLRATRSPRTPAWFRCCRRDRKPRRLSGPGGLTAVAATDVSLPATSGVIGQLSGEIRRTPA